MRFTRNNLTIENQSLLSYLLNNVTPVAHKQENGNLVSVYESDIAIENLEKKIKTHRRDARYNQWTPLWESHIKALKELDKCDT